MSQIYDAGMFKFSYEEEIVTFQDSNELIKVYTNCSIIESLITKYQIMFIIPQISVQYKISEFFSINFHFEDENGEEINFRVS